MQRGRVEGGCDLHHAVEVAHVTTGARELDEQTQAARALFDAWQLDHLRAHPARDTVEVADEPDHVGRLLMLCGRPGKGETLQL